MKNLHVLPTNKPSRLWTNNLRRRLELDEFPSQHPTNIAKHIYITSDEEIKEGDWCINLNSLYEHKELCRIDNQIELERYAQKTGNACRKIILTTDQDLIKDGVQAIDDNFLEWFVKNPSCEEVETIKVPYHDESGYSYLLGIPKEEPKQKLLPDFKITKNIFDFVTDLSDAKKEEPKEETLEEAAENYKINIKEAIQFGAKWQAERMYSEEEVFSICREFAIFVQNKRPSYKKQLEWFKQFKKK